MSWIVLSEKELPNLEMRVSVTRDEGCLKQKFLVKTCTSFNVLVLMLNRKGFSLYNPKHHLRFYMLWCTWNILYYIDLVCVTAWCPPQYSWRCPPRSNSGGRLCSSHCCTTRVGYSCITPVWDSLIFKVLLNYQISTEFFLPTSKFAIETEDIQIKTDIDKKIPV